jgi:hypothetical protein
MEETHTSNIESTVRPLLDAIKSMTKASDAVLLIKNQDGRHCIGGGNLESSKLIFSIASYLAGVLAMQIDAPAAPASESEHTGEPFSEPHGEPRPEPLTVVSPDSL